MAHFKEISNSKSQIPNPIVLIRHALHHHDVAIVLIGYHVLNIYDGAHLRISSSIVPWFYGFMVPYFEGTTVLSNTQIGVNTGNGSPFSMTTPHFHDVIQWIL